jgi:phage virion morphogenesis protein
MAIKIRIEVDNKTVLDALNRLQQAAARPRPALLEIGEDLLESTQQRFSTQTAPDGSRWERNSPSTIKRKGRDRPLVGETGTLMNEINYQLIDDATLEVGSPKVYAAMQQFGGMKSQFPHLWGDIPARPFIGVSDADGENILQVIERYLKDQL